MKELEIIFYKKLLIISFMAIATFGNAVAQKDEVKKQENVIYGMISGVALLMDVYQPVNSNHRGIVFIAGSGFGFGEDYQKTYNQVPVKDDYFLNPEYAGKWSRELVEKGYTVFMIDHRFSPKFRYPDPVEDARRAVRYVRYHAKKYKIDAGKMGAMGHSSGGYLIAMLGVLDDIYANPDQSPVDSVSSKVQAVVALASPFVLSDFDPRKDTNIAYNYILSVIRNYLGELPDVSTGDFALTGTYADASPITHVSKEDAPMMIYASDDDPLIPLRHASAMHQKLMDTGVEAKLTIDPKAGHEPKPDMNEVDDWFKKYLN